MSNDNTINGLQSVLFDSLRDLRAGNLDLDRAKAINATAATIIASAKVEVDYARVTGMELDSGLLAPQKRALEYAAPKPTPPVPAPPALNGSNHLPPNGPMGRL